MLIRRTFSLLLLITCLGGLGGCLNVGPYVPPAPGAETSPGTPNVEVDNSGVATQDPTPGIPSPKYSQDTPNNTEPDVTLALLRDSAVERGKGNYATANAYLERAIRIAPRRADLWLELATLRVAQNQPAAAINFAQKALALSGNRLDWQRSAWLVIAAAKVQQGKDAEALQIRERWHTTPT